jgi:hypothetical protein
LPPRRDYGRDGKMGRVWVEKIIEKSFYTTLKKTLGMKNQIYINKNLLYYSPNK